MRTRAAIAILIPMMLGLCTSCATAPLKVPVIGNTSALAGRWEGEFQSNNGMRAGSIAFELAAGRDTAFGDVVLTTRGGDRAYVPGKDQHPERPQVEVLAIKFVSISGNLVRGTMERYRDPACGCQLRTVFDGAMHGDTITGTYRTYHLESRDAHEGKWAVRRSVLYANPRIDGNHAVGKAQ